jgi:single-strand DNA-binding protein
MSRVKRQPAQQRAAQDTDPPVLNEVHLGGRLATAPASVVLPSGDELVTLRLVVPRPPGRGRTRARAATVDTVDCSVWPAALRRTVSRWQPGDLIEVEGSLRRRFWRGPGGGPQSRYDVEVVRARRMRRA